MQAAGADRRAQLLVSQQQTGFVDTTNQASHADLLHALAACALCSARSEAMAGDFESELLPLLDAHRERLAPVAHAWTLERFRCASVP